MCERSPEMISASFGSATRHIARNSAARKASRNSAATAAIRPVMKLTSFGDQGDMGLTTTVRGGQWSRTTTRALIGMVSPSAGWARKLSLEPRTRRRTSPTVSGGCTHAVRIWTSNIPPDGYPPIRTLADASASRATAIASRRVGYGEAMRHHLLEGDRPAVAVEQRRASPRTRTDASPPTPIIVRLRPHRTAGLNPSSPMSTNAPTSIKHAAVAHHRHRLGERARERAGGVDDHVRALPRRGVEHEHQGHPRPRGSASRPPAAAAEELQPARQWSIANTVPAPISDALTACARPSAPVPVIGDAGPPAASPRAPAGERVAVVLQVAAEVVREAPQAEAAVPARPVGRGDDAVAGLQRPPVPGERAARPDALDDADVLVRLDDRERRRAWRPGRSARPDHVTSAASGRSCAGRVTATGGCCSRS